MDRKEWLRTHAYFKRKFGLPLGLLAHDLYWILEKWGGWAIEEDKAKTAFEAALKALRRKYRR